MQHAHESYFHGANYLIIMYTLSVGDDKFRFFCHVEEGAEY